MEPRVVVDLVERVVVLRQRVIVRLELSLVLGECCRIVLGEEVVAVAAIRVARACRCRYTAPADGSRGIEQALAADGAGRHLAEVVGTGKVVCREPFGLHGTAVAVDLHLAEVREASPSHQLVGQLVDPRRRYADFGPATRGQHRVGGIARPGSLRGLTGLMGLMGLMGSPLNRQLKAHQLLVTSIPEDYRHECHVERPTAARHTDVLLHLGPCRPLAAGYLLQPCHVGLRHVDELRVLYADGIDRVGIVSPQLLGIGEER